MKSELPFQEVKFSNIRNLDDLEMAHARYSDYAFPRHLHEEYIIGVIVQGGEGIWHRGRVHIASAGDVILINPGEPHSNYSVNAQGFAYRTFYPSVELLKKINYDITEREKTPCFPTPVIGNSSVFNLLLRLHIKLEQTNSPLEQEADFVAVMASLLAAHDSNTAFQLPAVSGGRCYITTARAYLEANYAENFSLRQLASVCGISPFHLLRTFRDEIGFPPFEYQNQLRISQAKKLLRDGWSIAAAAAETGFADQSHLTRHFKRIVGVTPGKYLRHRNNVQNLTREKI